MWKSKKRGPVQGRFPATGAAHFAISKFRYLCAYVKGICRTNVAGDTGCDSLAEHIGIGASPGADDTRNGAL